MPNILKSPKFLLVIVIVEFLVIAYQAYHLNASYEKVDINQTRYGPVVDSLREAISIDSQQGIKMLDEFISKGSIQTSYFEALSLRPLYGDCVTSIPPGKEAEYLKLNVLIKAKDVALSQFFFNGLDYASGPGCFNSRPDSIFMVNYIPLTQNPGYFTFAANVRTINTRNNEFKLSVKVFDSKNNLLGKFPKEKDKDELSANIQFIKYPFRLNDTLFITKKAF